MAAQRLEDWTTRPPWWSRPTGERLRCRSGLERSGGLCPGPRHRRADPGAGASGCMSEGGTEGCSTGRGLGGAFGVALGPGGSELYVTGIETNSVAVLPRDPTTGALNQLPGAAGCLSETGADGCSTARGNQQSQRRRGRAGRAERLCRGVRQQRACRVQAPRQREPHPARRRQGLLEPGRPGGLRDRTRTRRRLRRSRQPRQQGRVPGVAERPRPVPARSRARCRQMQKVTASTLKAGSRRQSANTAGTTSRTPGHGRGGLAKGSHRIFVSEALEPASRRPEVGEEVVSAPVPHRPHLHASGPGGIERVVTELPPGAEDGIEHCHRLQRAAESVNIRQRRQVACRDHSPSFLLRVPDCFASIGFYQTVRTETDMDHRPSISVCRR